MEEIERSDNVFRFPPLGLAASYQSRISRWYGDRFSGIW
jgi:hypothetical protein